MVFKNRVDAGRRLAEALAYYKGQDVVVYGLPRGGVVLAAEVARILDAPLDYIVARKIGHPIASEYAIGAVTEMGLPVWNKSELGFTDIKWRDRQVRHARQEAKRRNMKYGKILPPSVVTGKTAIVVDDGIATGLTMMAAVKDLMEREPRSVVAAVAVAPESFQIEFDDYVDDFVVLNVVPGYFGAVGAYFDNFPSVEDEEVRGLLNAYKDAPSNEPLDLEAMNSLLATIHNYPVTSSAIAEQAKRLHSSLSVVNFFESIPAGTEFEDKLDVMRRTEEVELLMEEEVDQPDEKLRSYE